MWVMFHFIYWIRWVKQYWEENQSDLNCELVDKFVEVGKQIIPFTPVADSEQEEGP